MVIAMPVVIIRVVAVVIPWRLKADAGSVDVQA
jgi:hypothetical protein